MSSKWDDLAFILRDVRWHEPEVVEHFKRVIREIVPPAVIAALAAEQKS